MIPGEETRKPISAIVLGAQWGDEGKGRVVDILAADSEVVVRYQGGANAGHTVFADGNKYVFHLLPSGVLHPEALNIIAHGCVVDPIALAREIKGASDAGILISPKNLIISAGAHMVTPAHRFMDSLLGGHIGTTGRGIGPAYSDRAQRTGIRLSSILDGSLRRLWGAQALHYRRVTERLHEKEFPDLDAQTNLMMAAAKLLQPYIGDTAAAIRSAIWRGKNILYEGAQGALLDLDQGSYPYVTSSNTTIGSAYSGGGVFLEFDRRIAVMKAYATRVGNGPFPTEQNNETGEFLRGRGKEFGATTGRPRRCGWLDLHMMKPVFAANGFNEIVLTKIDCLAGLDKIFAAVGRDDEGKPVYQAFAGWGDVAGTRLYGKLPAECRKFVEFIKDYLRVDVTMISTGPRREQIIL